MRLISEGTQIGKYRLIRPLGKGGEGCVWLAMHMRTEQLWAVKEINRSDGRMEYHELLMFKKLRHPSLPLIVDILETKEKVFLVMEYIRGETLEQVLERNGKITSEQTIDAGLQIAGALSYLHDPKRRILHLDLKPSNVILTPEGKVRLIDLGAAFIMGDTLTHRMVTDGYSAPEMYDRSEMPGPPSDVYGLGALMYVMVSGVRFSDFMIKSRISGCPESLESVIRNCLKRDPERRFSCAEEVRAALNKVKKVRNKEQRRQKLWASAFLGIIAAGMALTAGEEMVSKKREREWNYGALLAEASCADREQAFELYMRALFMKPSDNAVYEQYLDQCDSDGSFSEDEENELRRMMHTIPFGAEETYEELLQKNPDAYGQTAYHLGLIYWYDYLAEHREGRRIAAGWFGKAVNSQKEKKRKPVWYDAARIYLHMGSYYGSLAEGSTASQEDTVLAYWEDLQELVELPEGVIGSPRLELCFCNDVLEQIASLSRELSDRSIDTEMQKSMVRRVILRAERTAGPEETRNNEINGLMGEIHGNETFADQVIENIKREENRRNVKEEEEEACTERN